MKKWFRLSMLVVLFLFTLILLTGCEDDPVEKFVLSNTAYTTAEAIDTAVQPEQLQVGEAVYASVSFIESPKGMKYTVAWLLDGAQVYTEDKEMKTDKRGIIVWELPGDKASAGQLTLRVLYKDKRIFDKELPIK